MTSDNGKHNNSFNRKKVPIDQWYENLLPIIEKLNEDTYSLYLEESYPRVTDNPAIVPIVEQIAEIDEDENNDTIDRSQAPRKRRRITTKSPRIEQFGQQCVQVEERFIGPLSQRLSNRNE